MQPSYRSMLTAGCGLAALIATSATAQTAQTAAPAASGAPVLEEVIVTAQRRSERLQDVPITVTVFGAKQIQNARIQGIEDVVTRTPGLSFDAFPSGQPRPFIRGIGSADKGAAGDPSAAVFVDDVYLGRPAAVAFDAFDVDRIEVLKGPQGTLYGRNVVGGAVSVATKRPDPDGFDASVEGTLGNYDRKEAAGFVNLPFSAGKAALRASGSIRAHDGYAADRYTGHRLDDQDSRSGRVQLLADLNDAVRVQLGVDGVRDRANGPAQYVFDRDPTSSRQVLWTVNRDRKANASEIDGYQNRDTWGARGQLDWDLGFGTLVYIGSYRDLDYKIYHDFDGGNPTFNRAGISGGNFESTQFWSHELRLMSPRDSKVSWVAGLYSFSQRTDRTDLLEIYTRSSLTAPVPATLPKDVYDQHAKLDSWAAFADATVPVGERFRLFGGLRYSNDDKAYDVSNAASTALFRATERFTVSTAKAFNALTWRVGGDFRPAPGHLLYGQVSRGFKSGGFQDTPGSGASAVTPFAPELATQYEIGQKSQFFDRTLTWNNTLYWTDYADLQTKQVVGLQIITNNAGKATIKGYETSLGWQASRSLRLDVSYAYTDAKFDQYLESGEDFSGNQISRTPKNKLVVSPSYTFDLAGGAQLLASADYQYESKIFDDNSNNAIEVRQPSQFVDARLVYTAPGRTWQASLWGKNLTDEVSRTFQSEFFGANFGAYAPPRTFGATLRWNY